MRLNKHEAKEYRAAKLAKAQKGEGLYIYENITGGDMMLPKATNSGQTKVGAGQSFQGDNYFMSLVRNNQCKLVKELVSPKQQKEMVAKSQVSPTKLLTDQPDVITEVGKVEYVADKEVKPLNEMPVEPVPEVEEKLLNEEPIDGIDIILD